MPTWQIINKTMLEISKLVDNFDVNENSAKVFTQYGYIKSYCSPDKFTEWKANKTPSEKRWVAIFSHLESKDVPYLEFSRLIEFILCLPGSSAPVERVFSSAKNIWKTESSQLHVKTLKSLLFVKNNLEYTCVEFYDFLKKNQNHSLLKQIASQEKYDFKFPKSRETIETETAAQSNMSIESDVSRSGAAGTEAAALSKMSIESQVIEDD